MKATKRCSTQNGKLLALLAGLHSRPDYQSIAAFANGIMSLAAFRSQSGQEDSAKFLQARLTRALKKLSQDAVPLPEAMKELAL